MRKPLLILALAGEVLFGGGLLAQDAPTASPWKVDALSSEGQIQYDVNTGNMTATNGVRITYKPARQRGGTHRQRRDNQPTGRHRRS